MNSQPAKASKRGLFGEYRLVREAHRGHYGVLHAAVHEPSGQPAWLRVLAGPVSIDKRLRADVLEAPAFDPHPHLLGVREALRVDKRVGLASHFIAGLPLSTVLRLWLSQKPEAVMSHAVGLGADLLNAISHLHRLSDYVPGALVPAAMIVGLDGAIRIADAHVLAKIFEARQLREHFDHMTYRSPEQLVPKPPVSKRCDVFSLGTILHELLSCQRLFAESGRDAIIAAIREREVEVSAFPEEIGEVLTIALAKDPEKRFADAGAMAKAFEGARCASTRTELAAFVKKLIATHPTLQDIRSSMPPDDDVADGKSTIRTRPKPSPPPAADDGAESVAEKTPGATSKVEAGKLKAPAKAAPKSPPKPAPKSPPKPAPKTGAKPPPPKPKASGAAPPDAKTEPEQRTSPTPSASPPKRRPKPPLKEPHASDEVKPPTTEDQRTSGVDLIEVPDTRPLTDGENLPVLDSIPPPSQRTDTVAGKRVGRCMLGPEIARGGMATVHLGRWHGAGGFAKTVAVKRLHPQYVTDPEFVNMLLDEARVVSRIRHPNVTSTVDVLESDGELFIVMDYVHGVTLAHLLRQMRRTKQHVPVRIALRIANGMLHGLHAAHEARSESGERLGIIHRDVSPENVIIGVDGYSHLIDFGIARALGRQSNSTDGQVKGKLRYLSPEQVTGEELHGQSDVFSAAIVLWESLTRKRLYKGDNAGAIAYEIMNRQPTPPSRLRKDVAPAIDAVVIKGLRVERSERWAAAADMAEALEEVGGMASFREVGEWVQRIGAAQLERVSEVLKEVENAPLEDFTERLEGAKSTLGHRLSITNESGSFGVGAASDAKPPAVPIERKARGMAVAVGAAVLVFGGIVVGTSLSGDAETEPKSIDVKSVVAPEPEPPSSEPAPSAAEPAPAPEAEPAPEPAPEPSVAPSAPSVAPKSLPAWPTPGPRPTPNPRLPEGI